MNPTRVINMKAKAGVTALVSLKRFFSTIALSGKAIKTKKNENTTPQPNRNVGGEKKNHVITPAVAGRSAIMIVFHRSGFPNFEFRSNNAIASAASPATKKVSH